MLSCTTSSLVGQKNTQRWDFICIVQCVCAILTYKVHWLYDTRSHNLLNPSLTGSHIIAWQGNVCKTKLWIFGKCISFDIRPNHKSLFWSSFIQQYHSPFKAMNWGGTITFNPLLTFLLKAQCSSALQSAVLKKSYGILCIPLENLQLSVVISSALLSALCTYL